MSKTIIEQAEVIREAMDAAGLMLDEEQAMECVWLYKPWAVGVEYAANAYITYGVNGVGDPQLYKVVQTHVSQADWTPDAVLSLYTPIGIDDKGYPVWSQPTGAHDAYNKGDIVDYEGTLYQSTIDGNIWSPDAYPAGWKAVEAKRSTYSTQEDPTPFEDGMTVQQDMLYIRDGEMKMWAGRQGAKPEWDDFNWLEVL